MEGDSSSNISNVNVIKLPHHERAPLCTSRPAYRQGRKLTAVKVFTVNEESQHLLIRGVPALNLQRELKHLCMKYGEVKFMHLVKNYAEDEEPFTEVYHVLYERIQSARFSKHMIDDKSFYGGILHVCYAPELETVTETKNKLLQRKRDVLKRIKNPNQIKMMLRQTDEKLCTPIENTPGNETSGSLYRSTRAPSRRIQKFKSPVQVPRSSSESQSKSFISSTIFCENSQHLSIKNNLSRPSVQCRRPASRMLIPTQVKRIKFNEDTCDVVKK